jgi:hypothetical protein
MVETRPTQRKLAAILAADVAGYLRLIEADEDGTLGRLKALRAEVIDPKIAEHRGRLAKTTGDGLLVEFVSVVDALRCAGEIQAALAELNGEAPADRHIEFRIGIHQGDVVAEDGDIFGDGVNVAAPARWAGRTRWDLRLGAGARGRSGQARPCLRGYGRPGAEEYYPSGPRLPGGDGRRRVQHAAQRSRPAAPRQAVDAGVPFANMSGDPEQEYFADGMVEKIITALSRIRWLLVIARNSSFTYKGQAVDVKQVRRDLGVRYVLEGSVRKAGGRVRITPS